MQNSTLINLTPPIAFVCHDAGAANIIFEWIRASLEKNSNLKKNYRILVQGPAAILWAAISLPDIVECITISELLNGANVLVSGTGWASELEYDAINEANQFKIKSIAVIDHWVNYRKRFIRNGVEILPQEIWVTDGYALKMAEDEFESIQVKQMPNTYLENITKEVRFFERAINSRNNLLYLLEPIREAWGKDVENGEFIALDFFIQNIELLELKSNPSIKLRVHPSDSLQKYDKWLAKHKNHNIKLDNSLKLAESIAWSHVVVGCQTYAMIIALAVGRKVYSSIPAWAPQCILPHDNIIRISSLIHKKIL